MTLLTESSDGVLRLTLARPAKKNALTAAMYAALADALAHAQSDPTVHAVVVDGQGGVFTAGNDLEDFLHWPADGENLPVFRFMSQVVAFDKPLIAAVTGLAVGIGTTFLTHCDLVYSAQDARFILPFVSLGLCPEFGASLSLPALAGHRWATEKLWFGEPFSAQEAQQVGLVNRILPTNEVLAFALQQAARVRALPTQAVRTTKHLMKRSQQALLLQAMQHEADAFAHLLESEAAQAAFTAFLARKPAERKGKSNEPA